jgi:hypothetical protein
MFFPLPVAVLIFLPGNTVVLGLFLVTGSASLSLTEMFLYISELC